jgi:adenylyltransferase/sulfurtransferase
MALPPLVEPSAPLSAREIERYARHVLLPHVGMQGQRRLKNARVLVVGAGGLGSPVLIYLAAAGVGTIGVLDCDVVESSNLARQVVHGSGDVGVLKTQSAAATLASINPLVRVVRHDVRIDATNALAIIDDYDLVVDATDNFPTRYLLNDACVLLGKPDVWGSVYRFDAATSIWWAQHGPCYRCVFPQPPPPAQVPSCADGGVLGVVCAAIGSIQGGEAVKLIVGMGDPLAGRLMLHDGLAQSWDVLSVRKNPDCAICGEHPSVTALVDYQAFCGQTPAGRPGAPAPAVLGDADAPVPQISALQLADLVAGGSGSRDVLIVDVRSAQERMISSIPGARAVHLDSFRSGAAVPLIPFDQPVVIFCRAGVRAQEAARILIEAGHPDVRSLRGGVLAWVRDVDPAQPTY